MKRYWLGRFVAFLILIVYCAIGGAITKRLHIEQGSLWSVLIIAAVFFLWCCSALYVIRKWFTPKTTGDLDNHKDN